MCKYEHLITTTAKKEKIWSLWTHISEWNHWDNSIQHATLEGPFAQGTMGSMTLHSGRIIPVTITQIDHLKSFTMISKFPFFRLTFIYEMHPIINGVKITHRVLCSGVLSFLFSWFVGKKMNRNMPIALRNLATKAEQK